MLICKGILQSICVICKPSQYCPHGLAMWSPTLGDPA